MGVTIMNGARVGQQSLIAANALVPEGKTVPPGVLFAGVPGKVVRNLSKQELSGIRDNAQKCRELATTHATS
jgi:carbonic anhydrase/acetyltransferase-like protein (isoleucine patch superfamily)